MATFLQTDGGLHDHDPCHLATPVRFGRRRTDQVGHLVFTSNWLRFRGTVDVAVSWTDVASVAQAGRDLVVSLHGTRRILRFICHNESEATRARATAGHLTALAHSDPLQAT
jgi:hypothetical protein